MCVCVWVGVCVCVCVGGCMCVCTMYALPPSSLHLCSSIPPILQAHKHRKEKKEGCVCVLVCVRTHARVCLCVRVCVVMVRSAPNPPSPSVTYTCAVASHPFSKHTSTEDPWISMRSATAPASCMMVVSWRNHPLSPANPMKDVV